MLQIYPLPETSWHRANAQVPFITPSFESLLSTSLAPGFSLGSGTPTFTRATTAYQQDFEAKWNAVLSGEARFQGARRVANMLTAAQGSETIGNAEWISGGTPNRTIDTSDFPEQTTQSVQFATAATDSGYQINGFFTIGNIYRTTLWIKGAVGNEKTYVTDGLNTGGELTATVNWTRQSLQFTAANPALFIGPHISGTTIKYAGILIENVTGQTNQNPSEYVSVGVLSAPFHGANVDGVRYFDTLNGNTVASNIVTETTGAKIVTGASGVSAVAPVDANGPFGYLSEGARADVLGTTTAIRRTMTDVGWVVGATMTVGTATGIDGVPSVAASLTGGAVTATNTILFTTVLGSAQRTYGAWVRRKTGTGAIEMTDNGGTNWTDITASLNATTYSLVQVTRTQANPIVGFRITTNLDAIEVDFNTIEAAAFANPTPVPVNVSKAADALTYSTSGNISDTEGATYAEITQSSWANAPGTIVGDGTNGPLVPSSANSGFIFKDGTNTVNGPVGAPSGVVKGASTWSGTTAQVAVGNNLGAAGSYDGAFGLATMGIGTSGFGSTRAARVYPRDVRAPFLQAITG